MARVRAERAFWRYRLHSTVLDSIGAVILQSRVCEQAVQSGAPDSVVEVRRLQGMLADLEALLRALAASRPTGRALRLSEEIRRLVDQFRRAHPAISVEVTLQESPGRVPHRVLAAATVVLHEALLNAARHAGPCRVQVVLAGIPGGVLLRIRDDGCGFDVRTQPHLSDPSSGRLGLRLMHEHATMAGGRVEVSSAPGRGTQVTLYCPLPAAARRDATRPSPMA
ncbi:MAG: ATP-binding protein [Armatimonadota bacterium]|nr:ATP-binding protein [Armatimonadota bacterium]MDR7401359.1 ATP-binding protein [Armatimonadota bacterium]MDR7404587.1 ATP-binding protein [Armatimonadota bacterium]MDR7437462.1 ATP-binding protein [Armatimonadota bacterium]MDR7472373.1 ATP-binding protein [Armatimonadota bacterium]